MFKKIFGIHLALISLFLLIACGSDSNTNPAFNQSSASNSGEVYNWKMITSWPKNLPALGTSPEHFADIVGKMSNGRMQIRVYGANELVGGLEVFDAVSQGVAEIGHTGAYYWQGKIPGTPFFSTIPFGLTGKEQNAWLAFGGGNELWREIYAPFNLIPVRGGNSGTQMFGWFNKEINSLEDLQGLKMRIPALGGEVFRRAGGTPVTMQVSEVFTALQTGALDATEFVSPYNDLAAGYHTVAKYYYYPGWHEPGSTLETLFNKSAFEALPEDLQQILLAATEVMNQLLMDELTAKNNEALSVLVEEHNVELRKLPDDVLIELKRISDEVVQELGETDEATRRIYTSYSEFKSGVQNYHRIAEEAYIQARNL
ncbi:MAG: TRAP transporter substrate-binding protein [Gammaproteobacteria bacterium]|nr:ABC transporter substrate-binding protein [Gammaproteobacteria bacterium]MDP6097369.1 TRAP transporter substrate-binding protein [Gammaproteobacteria bacterium]MDP7456298.1 TRAP transporter substrate-binding protein [Gammaproteobacteria bacterium]